jgi:hypothetical protein
MRWINERCDNLLARVQLVEGSDGWVFLSRSLAVVKALQSEPVVSRVFAELLHEEDRCVAAYRATYDATLGAAKALRERVEASEPAWLRHTTEDDDDLAWQFSVEGFDRQIERTIAAGSLGSVAPAKLGRLEADHVEHVLRPLENWIPDDADDGWIAQLHDVKHPWELAVRIRTLDLAGPGAAAARLVQLAATVSEERPRTFDAGARRFLLRNSTYGALYTQIDGGNRIEILEDGTPAEANRAQQALLADLRVVTAEIRFRLLGMQSLIDVVNRFKHRCEAFLAKSLLAQCEDAPRPEDVLRDACATYVFDQGIDVITEAPASQLRADILGAAIYVEAKQYKTNRDRSKIVSGFRQLLGTLLRLRASPLAPSEAFFVVFRRSGAAPLYELPSEPLLHDGLRIHCVLIDLAPTDEAGSREQQQMVAIAADELWPAHARTGADAAAADAGSATSAGEPIREQPPATRRTPSRGRPTRRGRTTRSRRRADT